MPNFNFTFRPPFPKGKRAFTDPFERNKIKDDAVKKGIKRGIAFEKARQLEKSGDPGPQFSSARLAIDQLFKEMGKGPAFMSQFNKPAGAVSSRQRRQVPVKPFFGNNSLEPIDLNLRRRLLTQPQRSSGPTSAQLLNRFKMPSVATQAGNLTTLMNLERQRRLENVVGNRAQTRLSGGFGGGRALTFQDLLRMAGQ